MTVSYNNQIHTAGLFTFVRLLFLWRGSIYKLLLGEVIVFALLYTLISLVYNFLLPPEQKEFMTQVVEFTSQSESVIPFAFFLGFFVSHVYSRFWKQFTLIPWPDKFAFLVSSYVVGMNRRARLMRRTLVRYVVFAIVTALTHVSVDTVRRFPTVQHFVDSGFLTENEAPIFDSIQSDAIWTYVVPLSWASSCLHSAMKQGILKDTYGYHSLQAELDIVRGQIGGLSAHSWVPLPLSYVHVVIFSIYSFIVSVLLSRQSPKTFDFHDIAATNAPVNATMKNLAMLLPTVSPANTTILTTTVGVIGQVGDTTSDGPDSLVIAKIVIAVITLVQFFVVMGLLRCSETMCFPFGPHDSNLDVQQLVDRHLQVSYLIVDDMYNICPELMRDVFWDQNIDEIDLPYTEATKQQSGAVPFAGINPDLAFSSAELDKLGVGTPQMTDSPLMTRLKLVPLDGSRPTFAAESLSRRISALSTDRTRRRSSLFRSHMSRLTSAFRSPFSPPGAASTYANDIDLSQETAASRFGPADKSNGK